MMMTWQAVVSSPGNHEAAMQLIEMTHCRLGVKLNSSCYSPVIKAAGEAGNSTMVWRVYQQLRVRRRQRRRRSLLLLSSDALPLFSCSSRLPPAVV